jgi:paraquat-inducible protein A
VLAVNRPDAFAKSMAYSLAALVALAVALTFPFLSISTAGVANSMTLPETVSYLSLYGAQGIAVVVAAFVIVVPVIMLTLMAALSLCLLRGRFPAAMLGPTRWLFRLDAWAMVEVFGIGVIVSLVKLSTMVRVSLGTAFWAYLAFAILFLLAYSCLDRYTVWEAVDRISRRQVQA